MIFKHVSPPRVCMSVFLHANLTKTDLTSFRLSNFLSGLAYDHKSGFVFVVQHNVSNVFAVDVTTGAVMFTIGESSDDVALDDYGNLLVADRRTRRIAVFDASNGTPITSFHSPHKPRCVFVDQLGNVIVSAHEGLFMWRPHCLK